MIYELLIAVKSDVDEAAVENLFELTRSVTSSFDGKVLLEDDWGVKNFAQMTSKGLKTSHFIYVMYVANNQCNKELHRRLKIDESMIKCMIIKLSDCEKDTEYFVSEYKSSFSKKHPGSITDKETVKESEKERRMFFRRKTCWFTINQIRSDWKDPATYTWLVNEFGKISSARVSGITKKHQKISKIAIKRARQMGLLSHISNRIAD